MLPNWDDFTSNYGFGDGLCAEPLDGAARELLIDYINKALRAAKSPLIIGGLNNSGHNPYMVLVLTLVDDRQSAKWHIDHQDEHESHSLPGWFFGSFNDDVELPLDIRKEVAVAIERPGFENSEDNLIDELIHISYQETRQVVVEVRGNTGYILKQPPGDTVEVRHLNVAAVVKKKM